MWFWFWFGIIYLLLFKNKWKPRREEKYFNTMLTDATGKRGTFMDQDTNACLARDLAWKFNRVSSQMICVIKRKKSELRERDWERERMLLDGKSVELLDREQESNYEDSRIVFQWVTRVTGPWKNIGISYLPLELWACDRVILTDRKQATTACEL